MKIEADAGYIVKIGEPVCIAEVKATSTSVSIPCDPIADGDYLISLEVNGTVTARRESFSFASGSATVGDYTVAYESNAVTVSTTEENDIVNIMIEPLKVFATDEFKAAVAKVAPKAAASGGGGTGGGVLVVTDTDGTLDKTFKEINDAYKSGVMPVVLYDGLFYYLQSPPNEEYFGFTAKALILDVDANQNYFLPTREYTAESANDNPVYDP